MLADLRMPQPEATRFGDFTARLPAPVRMKLKKLRRMAEGVSEARRAVSEKRQAVMGRIDLIKSEIAEMTALLKRQGLDDSAQLRAAVGEFADLREDLDVLNAAYARPDDLPALVASLERYLAKFRDVGAGTPDASPDLRKGETIQAAIETRRRRLRELAADLKSVSVAPWPSSISKERAREQIAALRERGRPDVFALVERGDIIGWPILPIDAASQGQPLALNKLVDSAALVAWALGPALLEAVEREIEELSDDEHALTAAQRKDRTEQIAADMLAVEREEEALIERAEKEGLSISRRAGADPRAVLWLATEMRAPERFAVG